MSVLTLPSGCFQRSFTVRNHHSAHHQHPSALVALAAADTSAALHRGQGQHHVAQFHKTRHTMTSPNLSSILRVITKVFGCHHPVLIANQPILGDCRWIKLNLQLHVLRNRNRTPSELLNQNLSSFPRPSYRHRFHCHYQQSAPSWRPEDCPHQSQAQSKRRRSLPFSNERLKASSLVIPTFKSPSVASSTRFAPPSTKFSVACS